MRSLPLRIGFGFTTALILSIIPLPEMACAFRPPWILLLILYIEYFLPGNLKLLSILIIGLLLDVLLSTVIGEHALSLLLVTWVASSKSRRFQFFSMLQQLFLIGFFCLLYQSILTFIDALLALNYSLLDPVASGLVGLFIWPWIRLFADDVLFVRA